MCWHALPPGTTKEVLPDMEKRIDIPYNLFFQTTRYNDNTTTVNIPPELRPNNQGFGPQPLLESTLQLEKAGVYAARMAFPVGTAEPPRPCFLPNQKTESGKCVLPCISKDYKLIGETCYKVELKCPTNSTDSLGANGGGTYCTPKSMAPTGAGPSIIAIVAMIAIVAVLGGLVVKLVASRAMT